MIEETDEQSDIRNSVISASVADLNEMLNHCPNEALSQYITNYKVASRPPHYWDALIALDDPVADYEDILYILRKTKENFPKKSWPKCMYARALWAKDKYADAITELNQALLLSPSHALTHSLLGETHYLLFNYHEAYSILNRALELQPGMISATCCRAYTQRYLADEDNNEISRELRMLYYQGAIIDFERATKLMPSRKAIYTMEIREIKSLLSLL